MQALSDVRSFSKIMLILAASATTLAASFSPSGSSPPVGHTGSFGEPSCHGCHSEYPLNEPGARIRLDSLPAVHMPEQRYVVRLVMHRAEMKRAGFQLTARFEDGGAAGRFELPDTTFMRTQRAGALDYLSHTSEGSHLVQGDSIVWRFVWIAPASTRRVVFSAALNAADNDDSPFGDRIFTASFVTGAEPVRK